MTIPTYGCKVYFHITEQIDRDVARYCRQLKIEEQDGPLEGMVLSTDMHIYHVLIARRYLTHNTIAHELFHLVCRICEDRGILEEESRCWLSGYVHEFLYKKLEKKNVPVSHG